MAQDGDNITIPPEFSGPAQLILFTRYGDPRSPGWENKWLTNWNVQRKYPWFPQKTVRIHKHFKPVLDQALTQLEMKDLHREIKTFDGCYISRFTDNNHTLLSVHHWGAAIDFNCVENPIGSIGNWTDDFINVMSENNIFCGQNWEGRPSPHHFAMVNG